MVYLLIEKHYVRLPHFVWRKPKHPNSSIVRLIPLKLIIVPYLNNPLK